MRIRDLRNFKLRNSIVACKNSTRVFTADKNFYSDYGGLDCSYANHCITIDVDPDIFRLMAEKYEKTAV